MTNRMAYRKNKASCGSIDAADNYAPFYSTPIECSDRDAATVLDGLLYNERLAVDLVAF